MSLPSSIRLDAPATTILGCGKDDEKKQRRFSMCAYTGAVFDLGFGPAVIELSGMTVTAGVPVFRQHNPELYVGRSDSISMELPLMIEGTLFDNPAAKEVASLSDQGAEWQASLGIDIDSAAAEFVGEDESAEVNGASLAGPVLVLRKTTLKETSFVPLGADPQTSALALSGQGKPTEANNMADDKKPDLLTEERERVKAIRAEFTADPGFALQAIDEGWSLLETKAAWGVRLAEKIKAQTEEHSAKVAELEAKLAKASKPSPAAALTATGSASGDAKPEDWEGMLAAEITRLTDLGASGNMPAGLKLHRSCGVRAMAANHVAKAHPDIHKAYLAAANERS